ncbi:segregation/condensation protein A [Anaerovorax odorimutans]|uniref:Segregation and condensation protein A n=1 Tax=Anaerovorax odorimutans TaxID=109327 RepID=A0ABT1RTA0_9FIRM|nr:segregation/condensation protein A [Anaerovorax odorimutans]MCQ4638434.1 segregation/condensation protein A [Anaerovorax odorimutans]
MGYKVKLGIFEGPFDLLVYLIENAQMNIYDIQISEITRQYLSYMEAMRKLDVPMAAEFMVLAAALIEIKSKMLLPRTAPSEEGPAAEDPRTDLVEKLLEYKRFKLLAEMLQQQEEQGLRIMEKPQEDLSVYTGQPDEYLDLDLRQFVSAFNLFLRKKKKVEEIRKHHIRSEKQRITAEARMADIRDFFREDPFREADFKDLIERKDDKYDIALTFSSLLEMMKEKKLEAEQKYIYGDIKVKATEFLIKGESDDE